MTDQTITILVDGKPQWTHVVAEGSDIAVMLDGEPSYVDVDHAKWVKAALRDTKEHTVQMMFGELFLLHVLLQDYGISLVGDQRFIPLLIRSKERIEKLRT